MIYGYQCRECGQEYDSEHRGDFMQMPGRDGEMMLLPCSQCPSEVVKRKYSISIKPIMHEHLNQTTGTLISSDAQFRRELRMKSDLETERTGIPCNYEPVDPDEVRAHVLQSDAVGLDATNRKRVNEGKPPIRIEERVAPRTQVL